MQNSKIKWIHLRYLYPSVSMLILFILLFIPCFSFVTSSGVNAPVSIAELVKNSWEWGSQCIFGSGIDQTAGNIYFSQTVMILVAVFYLLFAVAFGTAIYLAVTAFMYFGKCAVSEKNRIIFLTFFFNRVVVSVLLALALPIFLFPKILPLLYLNLLNIYVELRLTFIDPVIIAVIIFAVGVVISALTVNWERGLGMDVFSSIRSPDSAELDQTEQVKEKSPTKPKETPFEEMSRKAKEEQTERILKLLNKNKDEE